MNHHDHTCLNCGQQVTGAYCGHCGQKAETHRFTIRHFIEHDIVHGMFHLDKGFVYTAKQLFTRPGYAIREYIEGKRASYFNPVTLLLLMIGLNLFVQHSLNYDLYAFIGRPGAAKAEKIADIMDQVQHFQLKYAKQLYLLSIPILSLCTFLIFRKTKQNYAEHMVLNTYREAGLLVVNTIFVLLSVLSHNVAYTRVLFTLMGITANVYSFSFYWQYFRKDYEKNGALLIISIIGNLILYSLIFSLILILLVLPRFGIHLATTPG